MYNQSFTAETLQEIFDSENRKGKNIENKFKIEFEKSLKITKELKNINKIIKKESDSNNRITLFVKKKELKKERAIHIKQVLELTVKKISKNTKIELSKGQVFGKQSYNLENSIENYFISKKLQKNLLKSYNVKQSNRYTILSQLVNLIEDQFPKYVIRTDIKSFYESIPQKMLRDKINEDYLLSIKSKEYINQTLDSYNNLTSQNNEIEAKGIPRGVGFSPYLSELFMRKIDSKLRKLDDVIYYARYVDDIIIMFVPKKRGVSKEYLGRYKSQITDTIEKESAGFLKINSKKTNEFNLLNGLDAINHNRTNPKIINFLGYKFGSDNEGSLKLLLSDNKIKKYKKKIKLAFDCFEKKRKHNQKESFKLLKARIEYLTSNTKLRNNKDKVFVGIYYSNSFLNNTDSLIKIQKYLNWYISRANLNINEKEKLLSFNFAENFQTKKFVLLPLKKKIYKNYNNISSNNKGVIQYGLTEINSIWK